MPRLLVDLRTGEVEFYPLGDVAERPHCKVVEVTKAIQKQLDAGGPFRWEPNDLEKPDGPGKLVKIDNKI